MEGSMNMNFRFSFSHFFNSFLSNWNSENQFNKFNTHARNFKTGNFISVTWKLIKTSLIKANYAEISYAKQICARSTATFDTSTFGTRTHVGTLYFNDKSWNEMCFSKTASQRMRVVMFMASRSKSFFCITNQIEWRQYSRKNSAKLFFHSMAQIAKRLKVKHIFILTWNHIV